MQLQHNQQPLQLKQQPPQHNQQQQLQLQPLQLSLVRAAALRSSKFTLGSACSATLAAWLACKLGKLPGPGRGGLLLLLEVRGSSKWEMLVPIRVAAFYWGYASCCIRLVVCVSRC